jgi:hypothetical protein
MLLGNVPPGFSFLPKHKANNSARPPTAAPTDDAQG